MDRSELIDLQKKDPNLDRLVMSVYPRSSAEENQTQVDMWSALARSDIVKHLVLSVTEQCKDQQAALLRALELNKSIEEISVCAFCEAAGQKWNEQLFSKIIEALGKNATTAKLQKLDLCPNSGLTELSCASLSQYIGKSASLKKLKLFIFQRNAANLLVHGLRSSNIECLDLVLSTRNNRLDQEHGSVSFPFFPSSVSSMTSLKELRLMLTPHGKRLFEPEELQATCDDFCDFMITGFSKLTSLQKLRLDYPYISRSSISSLSHGINIHNTIQHLAIKWEDDMHHLQEIIPALRRLKSFDLTVISTTTSSPTRQDEGDVKLSSLMPLLRACRHLEQLHLQDILTKETTEEDFGEMTKLLASSFTNLREFRLSMNWDLGFVLTRQMMQQLLVMVQSNVRIQAMSLACHDSMFQPVSEFQSLYDQIQHACTRNRFRAYHALIKGTIPLALFPKLISERIDPSSPTHRQVLFDLMKEINGVLVQIPSSSSLLSSGKRKRLEKTSSS